MAQCRRRPSAQGGARGERAALTGVRATVWHLCILGLPHGMCGIG
jgi:hypothetical protein